ncbi:UPF0711 protein C18orf21 homolog isoform X1 [Mesoplodon densirostris]|uniref:UPF0711 protein C18orf21 homolog isoform X1 n=1 Tax=Mesoplodon densirostris TaxID=48708 RepID=UPI0028DBFEA1|nr:UPF0711 protein C18orf21 homolog isoform X1 [Mesoplodon densirostris]
MRQKHYLEAAARKLQDSCPGQARYLLWAYSSSHDDKSTFEGTCPYCFQLLIQDKSRVRLKPKSKLTPKIQKLLNREARSYTLSFKEAKILKKYKDSKSVLLITCKTCNRTVKHHGESRSFLSTLKSNPTTPASKLSLKTPERKTLSSAKINHDMSGSKAKSPSLIFRYVGLSLLWPLPLRSTGSGCPGSAATAHGPSRSAACGIFPDRGRNPCRLHRQADSQPLRHQGSP